ncbi:MAG TPA: pyrimidine reductase family protein [Micromonosporaceae bacterium]|nr:pyrimidine reductase family protein [Micromonosporaceae bacterium]
MITQLRPDPEPLDEAALTELYVDKAERPLLRANFVTSIDGAVELDGYSAGLSGPADKQVFGLLRMVCDALLVGAGTLRHEGYREIRLDEVRRRWRLEHGLAEYPTMVVVSGRLALDPTNRALAAAPVRPIVVTHASAVGREAFAQVADIVAVGDDGTVDLRAALAELNGRGLRHVLCEGGPHLLGALTAADLVDEMCLTVSPLLTGPGAGRITAGPICPDGPRQYALRHVLVAGDMLLLRYAR